MNSIGVVAGVDREVAVLSLEQRITASCEEYNKQGGCVNAEIERLFPLMIYRRR